MVYLRSWVVVQYRIVKGRHWVLSLLQFTRYELFGGQSSLESRPTDGFSVSDIASLWFWYQRVRNGKLIMKWRLAEFISTAYSSYYRILTAYSLSRRFCFDSAVLSFRRKDFGRCSHWLTLLIEAECTFETSENHIHLVQLSDRRIITHTLLVVICLEVVSQHSPRLTEKYHETPHKEYKLPILNLYFVWEPDEPEVGRTLRAVTYFVAMFIVMIILIIMMALLLYCQVMIRGRK
jgi:hypothetical protein